MDDQMERATPVQGACLGGAVRFEFVLPTLFCGHCHCSMCRRAHGASHVTWIGVKVKQLSLTTGLDQLAAFSSSDHGKRSFCDQFGSSLFYESDSHPDVIDIVLANLQDLIDRAPQAHYYFSDRAEWTAIGDEPPRFGGETGTDPLAPQTPSHCGVEKHA